MTAQEPWQAPTAALGWEATRYPALAERAPHISDGLGPGPHLDAVHGHDGVPTDCLCLCPCSCWTTKAADMKAARMHVHL